MKLVNIFSSRRNMYLFCRDDKGNLIIEEKNDFFPYFYELNKEGKFKTMDGQPAKKVFVSEPSEIPKARSDNSYEADVLFVKRYMIDRIKQLDKCPIKYTFIDIEVLADELPNVQEAKYTISCISLYNSMDKKIQTWYLGDCESEFQLINNFVNYMKTEKFDLWLSWNVKFDYNYLSNRIEVLRKEFKLKKNQSFPTLISPINKLRYGDGEVFYPAGISIVDYLLWDKKATLNRRKSYALDNVAQEVLKDEPNEKIEFGILSPKIKEKNIHDIERMVKLEEKLKYIDYFDEIRRLAKVEWEDMIWNSRILDMLLLQEAKEQKIVLPMKPSEERGTLTEKEKYQGAYRKAYETGAFYNVGKYDLTSAYPSAIIYFCLDPANIRCVPINTPTEEGDLRIEDSVFRQNPKALLPTVVKKLMTIKNEIKKSLKSLELNTEEYKNVKKKYEAIKSVVNSSYGVFGNRFFRLYDKRVAAATTFIVRSLLHYVKDKIELKGYKVIYVDTDSVFIEGQQDLAGNLNSLIKLWAKETFNKENINIEFAYEGNFEKLLILTLCRYKGWLKTEKGVETETKGIEAKRKDSTEFMKKFQIELINKILDKEPKEQIFSWIRQQIKELPNQQLKDIAFPCKLAKQPSEYKNVPIFVRALTNTPDYKKKVGELFYYIFVKLNEEQKTTTNIYVDNKLVKSLDDNLSRKEGIEYIKNELRFQNIDDLKISILHKKEKPKNVMAFDEENYKHVDRNMIDWNVMVKRNVLMKLDTIFKAMSNDKTGDIWDLKEIEKEVK